jgi:hypothetical protein
MAYLLRPPSVRESPAGGGVLFSRYKIHRGICLLVDEQGYVSEAQYPTEIQWNAAKTVYVGGHEYVVDGEEAQVLLDAGYEDNLTWIGEGGPPTTGSGYGIGPYGSGPYGGSN